MSEQNHVSENFSNYTQNKVSYSIEQRLARLQSQLEKTKLTDEQIKQKLERAKKSLKSEAEPTPNTALDVDNSTTTDQEYESQNEPFETEVDADGFENLEQPRELTLEEKLGIARKYVNDLQNENSELKKKNELLNYLYSLEKVKAKAEKFISLFPKKDIILDLVMIKLSGMNQNELNKGLAAYKLSSEIFDNEVSKLDEFIGRVYVLISLVQEKINHNGDSYIPSFEQISNEVKTLLQISENEEETITDE